MEIIKSWTYDVNDLLKKMTRDKIYELMKPSLSIYGQQYLDSKVWSNRDLAVLAYNQSLVQTPTGRKPSDIGLFLSKLAAPYICNVDVLTNMMSLIFYERVRSVDGGDFYKVIESEELCCKITDVLIQYNSYNKNNLLKNCIDDMVDMIDFEIMSDIANNANLVSTINCAVFTPESLVIEIKTRITDTVKIIKSSIFNNDASIWMISNNKVLSKLHLDDLHVNKVSKNLIDVGTMNCSENEHISVYQTDLIENDIIILGTKDNDGYYFCPFIPFSPLQKDNCPKQCNDVAISSTYGKKLTREGSKSFGLIKLITYD